LAEFLKSGAAQVYGIEVRKGLADLARKRFNGTKWERLVQIDTYDGLKLPYPTDFFDIVFSMHVIEHTQDPALYLTESLRVLKPNGIIFLDVPNRFYRIEQHTLLPYLHFLPTRLRDMLIRLLLSKYCFAHLSEDARYKLEALIGAQFPTADQLIRICKLSQANYSLKLRDAFFHSYTNERVPYRAYPGKYLLGQAHRMTAFRMVVGKY
jgi:SAM-dependent methyltransferase